MSGIQEKVTSNEENQENMTHTEKKNQSFLTNSELIPVIELVDKDIKIVIIIVFHILKKLGEIVSVVSRDMEDVKKTTVKFLEMKAFMS